MKITGIKNMLLTSEQRTDWGHVLVKVETDAGIYGLGQSGNWYWGASVAAAVDHLSGLLIGQDPFATERLWQDMFRLSFFPADKVYCNAISSIDIALWDIKGKALNMPLYKLLGGPVRDKVVCYPHNAGRNTKELVDDCLKSVDEGWKFVRWGQAETGPKDPKTGIGKLEPVESIKRSVEQMAAVREAVGPDIQIAFDVHTRLDTAHVIAMCKDMEPLKPFFIEDPIRSENPDSYRTLARHVSLPLAAGEQWPHKWWFRQVIEEELISYARIDICNAGGLTESLKITHAAETHYIDIAPHNPLGVVSTAVGAALCMASTNVGVLELPKKPGTFDPELFPVQIGWENGYAFCNDLPGLGIEIDMNVAEKRVGKPGGFVPKLQRNDGAMTNW